MHGGQRQWLASVGKRFFFGLGRHLRMAAAGAGRTKTKAPP
jgi:hypothetical protein